ncbi:hypothetical protein [Methylobacterium pseudosasicola]|uniref:Uncharacterized protein n=1 Tax=Methylobacterium pseudosasicola TaxID=582667 RepID=A0A1I4QW10_9HYPH|nr:hypothetical protein [Methylobacterium pseudosasicola]SFM44248.1 hypothetical protein SAMN05192568_103166 [Methylobacterium pseudosasicola]
MVDLKKIRAAIPILAMLAALALLTVTGLSQRSGVPEAFEPWIYGYFIARYPLFAFALVYGLAHLATVAAGPGPASALRRLLFASAGAASLILIGLYPTFGGLILRGGFATGGMAFLTHQPLWLAYGLGAGVAAALFGGILGLFAIAANRPLRPSLRRIGAGLLAFLALWFGACVIGLSGELGIGAWPRRAFRPPEAGLAALLLVIAALPHALLTTLSRLRRGA